MSLTPRTTCGDARWRPSDSPESTDWLLLGGHLCSELTCRDRRSGRFVDFAKNLNGHVVDRRGAWEPMWVRADRRSGVDTNIECFTVRPLLFFQEFPRVSRSYENVFTTAILIHGEFGRPVTFYNAECYRPNFFDAVHWRPGF